MHIRLISCVLFLVLRRAFTLSLPPTDPIDSNNTFRNGPTVETTLNLTASRLAIVNCNGQGFGRDLSKDSCKNAWDKMPRSNNPHGLFPRPRSSNIPTMWRTPIHYLSDDGLCAIDVKLVTGSQRDTVTDRNIAGIAETILSTCVESQGLGRGSTAPCKS